MREWLNGVLLTIMVWAGSKLFNDVDVYAPKGVVKSVKFSQKG